MKIFFLSLLFTLTANATYFPNNSNGQATMANSAPVTFASDQSAISTTVTPTAYNSTTGVLNWDMLSNAASGWYDTKNNYGSVGIDIYTTTTVTGGVLTFEQTNDVTNDAAGITWNLQDVSVLTQSNVTTLTLVASTIKHYIAPINSRYVRVRISTAFIGTGTVGITAQFRNAAFVPLVQPVSQATAGSLNGTMSVASAQTLATVTTVGTVSTITADNIAPGTTNGCFSPGSTLISITGTTSGTAATQIIALVASKKIFICSLTVTSVSGTTPTFSLVQGTGTNCVTTQSVLVQAFATATTAGTLYTFANPVAVSTSAFALCYLDGGTSPVQNYQITYTQQ